MMSAYAYNTVEIAEMLCQNVRSVVCTTLKYVTIMKIISFILLFRLMIRIELAYFRSYDYNNNCYT